MKRIVLMFLLIVSSISVAEGKKVKGVPMREINGFEWYCYKNKVAYVNGEQLVVKVPEGKKTRRYKNFKHIHFYAADKDDKGIFVAGINKKYDIYFDRHGNFICEKSNEFLGLKRIKMTFSNGHIKYYTEALTPDIGSFLFKDDGNGLFMEYSSFEVVGNVFVVKMHKNALWRSRNYAIYDEDGNDLAILIYEPEYIKEANHLLARSPYGKTIVDVETGKVIIKGIDYIKYENGIIAIEDEGKKGLMSYDGKWIVSSKTDYDTYEPVNIKRGVYKVKFKGSNDYHLLTNKGVDLFKCGYDDIEDAGGGYVRIKSKGYYGIMKLDGELIVSTSKKYTSISNYNRSERNFSFKKKGYKGVVNHKGKVISLTKVPLTLEEIKEMGKYSSVQEITDGGRTYFKVKKDGRYGLTDHEGKMVSFCNMGDLEPAGSGFLRYERKGYWGVMTYSGNIIISEGRRYTSISDFNNTTKRFVYAMDGYTGECDSNGLQLSKEEIKPQTYENVSQNNSNEHNGTKSTAGLLYSGIYTKSGQGRSQTTGQYTNDIGSSTWEVEIYEDYISVGGGGCPLTKKNGNNREYSGDIMGTYVTYYVDGNYNIREVSRFDGPFSTDWFEYTMTKGESTMPRYATGGGSYSGNNSLGNSQNKRVNQPSKQQQTKHECSLCHGKGTIIRESLVPTFGNDTQVYCSTCGRSYFRSTGHSHITCPQCHGKIQ